MYMLEIWNSRNLLDKGGCVCCVCHAMFMELSKAFDTTHHDSMIAKLAGYGFSRDALQYMTSYLTNRRKRVWVKSKFSTCENIIARVSQGSILGSLFFISSSMTFFFFIMLITALYIFLVILWKRKIIYWVLIFT